MAEDNAPLVPSLRVQLYQHQSSEERTPVPISSHDQRDRVWEIFRDALMKPGHPSTFSLQALQEAVGPKNQTVLTQDENQLLENGLRALLQELVTSAVEAGEPTMHHGESIAEQDAENNCGLIPKLLDIVLYLCQMGHVEGGLIFQLLEDLTEMSTIRDCKEVFGYIESKQEVLGKAELLGRGKLVMLRTCNQLLRRLSKASDVVFCGRILMFLAHFFSLSERSAVNIKGIFNTANDTKYENPDMISSIESNFYQTFWSLQEYFCNPAPMIHSLPKWQSFTASLAIVLDVFENQPLGDHVTSGNADDIGEEVQDHQTASSALDEDDLMLEAAFSSVKYLTSSNLMSLELKDPNFRRHVLVQCLIVLDYLKRPGKVDTDGLNESMKEEIRVYEERVKKLIQITPPEGKEFVRRIEHILEREQNWVQWKRDGCLPFERQPQQQVSEPKSRKDEVKKRRPRWRMGNKELSQLWKWTEQNPNVLTDEKRVKMPSVTDFWKELADDMDPSAGIEAEYHHKNDRVYCWKGLRFSARQDLEGFCRFSQHGIEGVVPPDLLPPEIQTKIHGKPATDKSKRAAKKGAAPTSTQASEEENQALNATVPELDQSGTMDVDVIGTAATLSGAPEPDERQKQSPDIEVAQGLQSPDPESADMEEGLNRDSSLQDKVVL